MMDDVYAPEKEIEEIKKRFSREKYNDLNILSGHVTDLARKIKMYSLISENSEKLNNSAYMSFFGWQQGWLLSSAIRVDAVKLAKNKNENAAIQIGQIVGNILKQAQYKKLIETGRLDEVISNMLTITEKFIDFRNKRDAHLILQKNPPIETYDLGELYKWVVYLYGSICHIRDYLTDPRYIVANELRVYEFDRLSEILQNDPAVEEFKKLIESISGEE